MPTGYTAGVADGSINDLKTFALQLARGMGALVMMRDEPWDAPIPDRFQASRYNKDRLNELKEEREEIRNLEGGSLTSAWYKAYNEADTARNKAEARHYEQRDRYLAMISLVEDWTGAPEGIKEFALAQLDSGYEFDCKAPYKSYATPVPDTAVEWKQQKLERIETDILYHAKAYAEECERTESRNIWIKQLKESLK